MKRWFKPENLHSLQDKHVFSSEELDLLMERIKEELEYASTDILRLLDKTSKNTHQTDY
jgi:acetoin utilization deacetylase AcuC-like enzyme